MKSELMKKDNELLSANSMLAEARSRLRHAELTVKNLRDRNDALIRDFQRVADDVTGRTQSPPDAAASAPPADESSEVAASPSRTTLNAIAVVSERLTSVVESKNAEIATFRSDLELARRRIAELEGVERELQQNIIKNVARSEIKTNH